VPSARFAVVAVALALAGCGTKEDVSLAVYARGATLTKGTNAFGSKLDGAVDVVFDLGHYGNESVRVEAIQLGIYRGTTQLVPGAAFELPMGTTLPIDLAPGQQTTFHYTISKSSITPEEATALCAGPVAINGTAKPTGKAEIALITENINVGGCP
jgi:hypothetical protein